MFVAATLRSGNRWADREAQLCARAALIHIDGETGIWAGQRIAGPDPCTVVVETVTRCFGETAESYIIRVTRTPHPTLPSPERKGPWL